MSSTKILELVTILIILIVTKPIHGQSLILSYDNLNRISAISYNNGTSIDYFYDAIGNRISATTVAVAVQFPTLYYPKNSAIVLATTVSFKWGKIATATSYRIQIGLDDNFANLAIDESSLTDTVRQVTLTENNTVYYWRVNATGIGGTSDWSDVWNFTTKNSINAPSNLHAISTKIKKVNLTWVDNSDNEDNFTIQRKEGDSLSSNIYTDVAVVQANQTGFLDSTGFKDTTRYTYRVYAINADTVSEFSNQAEAYTIVPVELISFIAKATEDKVFLEWSTATERNNSGYEVERRLEGKDNLKDNWGKISFVKGTGTTTEKTTYNFVDEFRFLSFKGEIGYRLKQIDYDGTSTYSDEINISVDFTPKEFNIEQNYPNPFNPTTIIKYALPYDSRVVVTVYSTLGKIVKTLNEDIKNAGYYEINFSGEGLSSGVYFYSINAVSLDGKLNSRGTKKMILMK